MLIGELLDFSTVTCPNLAKTWFRFADWSYVWGRQLLARSAPYVSIGMSNHVLDAMFDPSRLSLMELEIQVRAILPPVSSASIISSDHSLSLSFSQEVTLEEFKEVCRILLSIRIPNDDDSELVAILTEGTSPVVDFVDCV